MKEATMLRTKAGKGFKIVLNGEWFYTSAGELYKMMQGKSNAVNFRTIDDDQPRPQSLAIAQAGTA